MADSHYFIPVLGRRIRVTQVDEDGKVTDGESKYVVTDGFIDITLSSEVEDGEEIIQRNANGQICVNKKLADSFKHFTVEANFCGVHPDLLTTITNAEPYQDANDETAGFKVPEGDLEKNFALELWTGLQGEGGSASGYFLLPFVQSGVLGDIEITGEDAITFGLTGANTKGGHQWEEGPYDVVYDDEDEAGKLPEALDSEDHLLVIDTKVKPPKSTDGSKTVGDGEDDDSGN